MKQICSFIVLLFFALSMQAQKKSEFKFSSINQVGFLKGSSDQAMQIQTVNGVSFKTWFAGVGVGLDDYNFKTFTIFAELRKNISDKPQTPFVYVDLGTSIPAKKQEEDLWQTIVYKNGLYFDAGVGYQIPIKGNLSFNFSAGYSQKYLHETRTAKGIVIDFPVGGGPQAEYYDYTFKRLSIKMALCF
ncbi:MAG: hypothetical protein ACTHMD_09305 [Flavisolibacter sp.]